ncbi:MAG: substrate-binding domain-containing protein [Planctomycetes bacterium]|nr:substrate-binding domain-containing protein [Planctomycetota bacterium]
MNAPGRRVPHIGILSWTKLTVEGAFCREVFQPFLSLAAQGKMTYQLLCPDDPGDTPNDPFPPLERVKAAGFDAIATVSIWKETYIGELHKLGKPLVTLDNRSHGWPADSVTFGSRQAFRQIAQILKDTGHRDVLFISQFRPDRNSKPGIENFIEDDTSLDRRTALQEACAELDMEVWPLLPIHIGTEIRRKQVSKRLPALIENMGHPPSAISGHDSGVLVSALDALKDLKLNVPRDLSLISVGTIQDEANPPAKLPMDTLLFSWRQLGLEGLRLLWDRLSGKVPADGPPRHVELTGRYVQAGTVADRRAPRA